MCGDGGDRRHTVSWSGQGEDALVLARVHNIHFERKFTYNTLVFCKDTFSSRVIRLSTTTVDIGGWVSLFPLLCNIIS